MSNTAVLTIEQKRDILYSELSPFEAQSVQILESGEGSFWQVMVPINDNVPDHFTHAFIPIHKEADFNAEDHIKLFRARALRARSLDLPPEEPIFEDLDYLEQTGHVEANYEVDKLWEKIDEGKTHEQVAKQIVEGGKYLFQREKMSEERTIEEEQSVILDQDQGKIFVQLPHSQAGFTPDAQIHTYQIDIDELRQRSTMDLPIDKIESLMRDIWITSLRHRTYSFSEQTDFPIQNLDSTGRHDVATHLANLSIAISIATRKQDFDQQTRLITSALTDAAIFIHQHQKDEKHKTGELKTTMDIGILARNAEDQIKSIAIADGHNSYGIQIEDHVGVANVSFWQVDLMNELVANAVSARSPQLRVVSGHSIINGNKPENHTVYRVSNSGHLPNIDQLPNIFNKGFTNRPEKELEARALVGKTGGEGLTYYAQKVIEKGGFMTATLHNNEGSFQIVIDKNCATEFDNEKPTRFEPQVMRILDGDALANQDSASSSGRKIFRDQDGNFCQIDVEVWFPQTVQ